MQVVFTWLVDWWIGGLVDCGRWCAHAQSTLTYLLNVTEAISTSRAPRDSSLEFYF